MPDVLSAAILLTAGFLVGATIMWILRRTPPVPDDRAASMAIAIRRLTHDIRGALSPALLAAERLERHDDPAARESAAVIIRTLQRVASLCRETSAAIKQQQAME